MTVIDIIFRVDEICKKFDKYDVEKQRELNAYGDDTFARLFAVFDTEIDKATRKSEMAAKEKDRATLVAMNAEIRRTKARLMEEIPKLHKLSQKKVKGLSKKDLAIRGDMVLALPERIKAIPDSTTEKKRGGWGGSSNKNIKLDSTGDKPLDENFFAQSEESEQFRQEYEMRKIKQYEGLDFISDGLDTLKNLAMDVSEEMDRQVPLLDDIDMKVDKASSDLRNTNVKLKETIFKMRSTRNMFIDIILTTVLLGIVSYLYNVLATSSLY